MVALLLLSSYLILYEQVLSRPEPECLSIIAKQQEYEAHEPELRPELDTILKDCWTHGRLKHDKWKHTSEEVCPNQFVKTETSKDCRLGKCYWQCSNEKAKKIESCYMSQSITNDLKRKNVGLKHLAIITYTSVEKSVSRPDYYSTCTGWIIDSTAMITAGHCGFTHQMSARPIGRYRVTQGWSGEKGSENAAGHHRNAKEPIDIYIDNNWRNINEDHSLARDRYDYSVWKFPERSFAGDKLFKIAKYNEGEEHLLFRAGYPGYLKGQGVYFVGDTTKVLEEDIFLKSQCYAGAGESGGPTWYLKTTGSRLTGSRRTDPIGVAIATRATLEDEPEPKITIKHTWSVKINDDILTWLCNVFEFKFDWDNVKRISIGCPPEKHYTSSYVKKNVISFSDARTIGAGESFIGIGDSVDTHLKSSHPVIEYYGALMKRTTTGETTLECTVFIVSSQIAITAAECFDGKIMSNWGKTFHYFIMPNWDANIDFASDLNGIDESAGIVISKIQTIQPTTVAVILLEQELDSLEFKSEEYPFTIVPWGSDMSRARKLFRVGYADKMLGNANHVYLYRDNAMNVDYGVPPSYSFMYFPFSYYKSDIGSVIFEYEGESKTAMINSIIIQNKIKKGKEFHNRAKAYMFNKELVEMIGKVMKDKFGLSKTIVSAICGEYGEHTSEIDMSKWKEYLPAKDKEAAHVGYFDYFDNYLYDNDNNDYIDLNEIYMEGFKSGVRVANRLKRNSVKKSKKYNQYGSIFNH